MCVAVGRRSCATRERGSASPVDEASARRLFRIGGMALLVAGSLYLLFIPLLLGAVAQGLAPSSADALIALVSSGERGKRFSLVLFFVIDLGVLVAFPVLAFALRTVDGAWPIVAIVPASVAMVYDMGAGVIEWAMTCIYDAYATAPTSVQSMYRVAADIL
jgi:hypothetical protein